MTSELSGRRGGTKEQRTDSVGHRVHNPDSLLSFVLARPVGQTAHGGGQSGEQPDIDQRPSASAVVPRQRVEQDSRKPPPQGEVHQDRVQGVAQLHTVQKVPYRAGGQAFGERPHAGGRRVQPVVVFDLTDPFTESHNRSVTRGRPRQSYERRPCAENGSPCLERERVAPRHGSPHGRHWRRQAHHQAGRTRRRDSRGTSPDAAPRDPAARERPPVASVPPASVTPESEASPRTDDQDSTPCPEGSAPRSS